MLEQDMEELIARYPAEFFPRNDFSLVGRQGSFPGVGRYDLLFKDGRGTNILMELKARPAKYEDADQLAKYHDALMLSGHKGVVLWLVAPTIPASVKEFLDNVGIEYSEIHVGEYRRVAEKVGYSVAPVDTATLVDLPTTERARRPRAERGLDAGYRSRVSPEFAGQVERLAAVFGAGHRFLRDLGDNRVPAFYLWTATNAHLYHKDSYCCYIVPAKNELKIRGRYNARIRSGTTDEHDLIFPGPVRRLIQDLEGFKVGWAEERGEWVVLGNATPPDFFDGFLELIRTVEQRHPDETNGSAQ